MTKDEPRFGEEFVRLALAIDEHMPGYVDSYFGSQKWAQEAKQAGKLPLQDLSRRTDWLATDISQAEGLDPQRKDFLTRQLTAMQMSLRLLAGETVSLAEEVRALYDVEPAWKDESIFMEAQEMLDQTLPGQGSLKERLESWKKSLEVPVEKVKELLPVIINRLRELTRQKFHLPDDESFSVEFVSNQPWSGYNWYLGNYKSRIDINTDLPIQIHGLPDLMAHEGYPGHHTELSIKELKLIRQMDYQEFVVNLINSPSCVLAEGIATTALQTVLTGNELEDWFRDEILPNVGISTIDISVITALRQARENMAGIAGNAAFMLHDQHKSADELSSYLQKYGLSTEKEAEKMISFISNPLYRSYIFTYHVGHDLLEELFAHGDRDQYFRRLLEEPVTPSQVREWIKN
jgi:hypothetical protein